MNIFISVRALMWSQAALYSDFYHRQTADPKYGGAHNIGGIVQQSPFTPVVPKPASAITAAASQQVPDWMHTPLSYAPSFHSASLETASDLTPPKEHHNLHYTPIDQSFAGHQHNLNSRRVPKEELTPPKSDSGCEDKPFSCQYPKCNYVTNRRNNLKRHHATMHERLNAPHYCCGNMFVRKADLRIHNKEAHKEGYVCTWDGCGKSFLRKALMDRHMKIHTGEKPFVCPICNYGTSHKSNLDRHAKIHTKSGIAVDYKDMYHEMYDQPYTITMQPSDYQPHMKQTIMAPVPATWNQQNLFPSANVNFQQQIVPSQQLAQLPIEQGTKMASSGGVAVTATSDMIVPDSTTADLSPVSEHNETAEQKYTQYIEQLLVEKNNGSLGNMLPPAGQFPVCDLSTLSSFLTISPMKSEPSGDSMDSWLRDKEDMLTSMIIYRDQNKHTIDNILGSH